MENYKEVIFNVVTGEVTERPYTQEEIAELKKAEAEAKALREEMAFKEGIKKAALNKLIDLGLTEEEIAAL